MRDQLQQRLNELSSEFEAGQRLMADLDAKRANLQESMLRISGAIQVLEEELAKAAQAAGGEEQQPEPETEDTT